jgi:hypothetical protein
MPAGRLAGKSGQLAFSRMSDAAASISCVRCRICGTGSSIATLPRASFGLPICRRGEFAGRIACPGGVPKFREAGNQVSILMFRGGSGRCGFKLKGESLETSKKLAGRGRCQNEPCGHDPPRFRNVIVDRIIKAQACQRYGKVAV